jgi:hypothetical protein
MTSMKTLATAALLSAMTAMPVFAQAAIQEPGNFAFFYPNRDVLNGGIPLSEENLTSQPPQAMQNMGGNFPRRERARHFADRIYRDHNAR